jgi:hypothetical protein
VGPASSGECGVELLVDQRVEQAVEHQVLGDEQLHRVLQHERVLDVAAQFLPLRVREPRLLGVVECARVAEQQARPG